MSRLDDELKQALAESEAREAQEAAAGRTPSSNSNAAGGEAASGDSSSSDAAASDWASSNSATTPVARERRGNVGMLIALLVIAGAILSFVLGQDSKALAYSMGVGDVLARQAEVGERKLKVQGYLVEGSLKKREEPCEFRFRMRDADADREGQIEVRYAQCIVPDTFRDVKGMPVEVTAEGQWTGDHLQASLISAKCPSKYEMQQRQMAGEAAPHGEGAPELNPLQAIPGADEGS